MSLPYEVPKDQKGSFLAFLFSIRFITVVRDYFKGSDGQADEVMAAFDLTAEEKKVVWDLHDEYYPNLTDGEKARRWASLVALLLPEFYDWTYNHQPPWWW